AGARIWIQGSILMVTDIEQFGRECQDLYDGKSNRASLEPLEPELRITLEATDRAGHMRADVEITPDHLAQMHRIRFDIDQSYLPDIIDQCAAIVTAHEVRGRPAATERYLRSRSGGRECCSNCSYQTKPLLPTPKSQAITSSSPGLTEFKRVGTARSRREPKVTMVELKLDGRCLRAG